MLLEIFNQKGGIFMEKENIDEICRQFDSLVIFRNLLSDTVISKFRQLIKSLKINIEEFIYYYAEFSSELFKHTDNFSEYLLLKVLEDENFYILNKSQNISHNRSIELCLIYELQFFKKISAITGKDLKNQMNFNEYLVEWTTSDHNFIEIYRERIKNISKYGYGIFSKYHMFIVENEKLVPVKNPDTVRISQLISYENERKSIIDNTTALLKNKPAANVLLYGDAGTGKSSTVKAAANEFKESGLRLIELKKSQLNLIPKLVDKLSKNPLKFILFIDDLSFTKNDDNFAGLKAVLEGSVATKAENIVVYATSNRRHLIKESFSDREGDEIHLSDTLQEMTSLSSRFGLTVVFSKPQKDEYEKIVKELAEINGISVDENKLIKQAETFAIEHSGRSPRVAKQFIDYLKTIM